MATGRTIIGVFDEPAMADHAIDALQNAGFDTNQIYHSGRHASGGGFLAGLKGLFTGDNADSGSVVDDLTHMGVSDDEARYYENEHAAGRAVVAVRASGREDEALNILQTNGAHSYTRQGGTTQTGRATTDATRTTGSAATTDTTRTNDYAAGTTGSTRSADYANETDEQRVLRLREEQLNVQKQRVQTGEVGVRKEVVSEQKTVNVPVTHEEVYIERRPVTDATVDDATPIGTGESIRVPVSEEKVNVNKETVVTGEVSLGKRAVQENQQVTDTVKREEARLDRSGNPIVEGADADVTRNTTTDARTDRTDTRNSY